ncbi:MAG: FAD-dependent oxidoreductase [Acidimicrobiia bacterium]|nr:FAD-dependent oxidoreductase [Acidimicrobiia bacterium]
MTSRVVIVGGGWSGCAAAVAAKKAGADEVVVLERTDDLLGSGLVGGIMRNNGRYTATEEMIALGAGELFEVCDAHSRHRDFEFPGHRHASLYDVNTISHGVREELLKHNVEIWLISRVADITRSNGSIDGVVLEGGTRLEGDVFVDATGTAGAQSYCTDNGNGCVMCIVRCPTFGPRVSIAGLAGVEEMVGRKGDGSIGAMSGSCKLNKDTMDPALRRELDEKGLVIVPLPESLINRKKLGAKACQQYATAAYAENVIVLDTGQAKLMTSYMPLHELRQVPGFERVRYEDPYSGTVGNSMRYAALSPRNNAMRVVGGPDNLFCAGEKAGLLVGHTEAMVTGAVAGHNAVRHLAGEDLLELPATLATGDAISYVRESMQTEEGMRKKYTFSGSVYFARMQELGLYTTDHEAIAERVEKAGMTNVFGKRVTAAV